MAKESIDSYLDLDAVDELLILCDEVMRATAAGAHRFIEPAPGVLARAKAQQHNLIFGRRGSGKSSLLRKTAADLTIDRRPISFVDMETFKGHSYPDVLISVLIKSLQEFKKWLDEAATTSASKTSFWKRFFGKVPNRPPFNKARTKSLSAELGGMIEDLEGQLRAPESSKNQSVLKKSDSSNDTAGAEVKGSAGSISAVVSGISTTDSSVSRELSSTYVSHKVEYLHQNILKYQRFFSDLSELSDGPSFLILDDLYHIRKADQPKVIDYFHRVGKGNGMWLKVGTIKHRTQWYQHSDPPVGVKLGDDAKEINLDISLERFETLHAFLKKILSNLMSETPPLTTNNLLNSTAIDRLIIASGGVVRDFIGIFSGAITQARERGPDNHRGPKVGAEDVNLATGEYDSFKREEFKLDSADDRESLLQEFSNLVTFCTEKSKCNVFLVSQELKGDTRDALDQLIDLRLVHPVKSRVTLKKGAKGALFEAYMLDLSQYSAARKVHQFSIVDLKGKNKDEEIRKSSLIYGR